MFLKKRHDADGNGLAAVSMRESHDDLIVNSNFSDIVF